MLGILPRNPQLMTVCLSILKSPNMLILYILLLHIKDLSWTALMQGLLPAIWGQSVAAGTGDGHGTHVAATAVGRNVGVAKEANVVAVRVLDCEACPHHSQYEARMRSTSGHLFTGSLHAGKPHTVISMQGTGTISDLVAGLDWVGRVATPPGNAVPESNAVLASQFNTARVEISSEVWPSDTAVATLSLGVPVGEWSRSLEEAARSLIRQFNISVVVASGNSDVDSCYIAPGEHSASLRECQRNFI